MGTQNITVRSIYALIVYTATFVDTHNTSTASDDTVVGTRSFTIETKTLEPSSFTKDSALRYYNVDWGFVSGTHKNITLRSSYSPFYCNLNITLTNHFDGTTPIQLYITENGKSREYGSYTLASGQSKTVVYHHVLTADTDSLSMFAGGTYDGKTITTDSVTRNLVNKGELSDSFVLDPGGHKATITVPVYNNNSSFEMRAWVLVNGTSMTPKVSIDTKSSKNLTFEYNFDDYDEVISLVIKSEWRLLGNWSDAHDGNCKLTLHGSDSYTTETINIQRS